MKDKTPPPKIPLPKALLTIAVSTCLIFGSCFFSFLYYKHLKDKRRSDPSFQIVAVVQTSADAEGLKTAYLTELLDLSVDRPQNIFSFNTQEAKQKLMSVPFIKMAHITKIRPGTLHVDYTLRKPIAYYADYLNTAIDAEGILFPFKPFFTPKNLPEIITGEDISPDIWGKKITGEKIDLAFSVLALTAQNSDDKMSVRRIDVSNAFASSNGKRQIVITLEDRIIRVIDGDAVLCVYPRVLRLSTENYKQQMTNYTTLRSYLREQDRVNPLSIKGKVQQAKPTIIDLRLSDLAFIAADK